MKDNFIHQYIQLRVDEYPRFIGIPDIESFKNRINRKKDIKLFLAYIETNNELTGWLQVNQSDKDGLYWFNMIVKGAYHRRGIGSKLLSISKKEFQELHGLIVAKDIYRKRDGSVYPSPKGFYLKNGFVSTGRQFIEYGNIILHEIVWKAE